MKNLKLKNKELKKFQKIGENGECFYFYTATYYKVLALFKIHIYIS